ncbi:MAG: hypothetical protein KAV82_01185 [Phycisphaerae bacterium]|nr:hypothetical protein [Phycisphaerae bacterium]
MTNSHSIERGWSGCARVIGVTAMVALVMVCTSGAALAERQAVRTTVLENTPERIVIDYQMGQFTEQAVEINGRKCTQIKLGKESLLKTKGAPSLPNVCRSIQIPNDARMAVRVRVADYYDLDGIEVVPSKGYILRKVNPADVAYTFGSQYQQDAFWPAELVSMRDPYIMRDCRGVVVEINPFRYNPVTRTLRVYTRVTVEVVSVGLGEINVLHRVRAADDLSLAFHKLYQRHFLNYGAEQRYDLLDEEGDMLIICHGTWLGNVQPLADHKNARGIDTTVVNVSDIGNNAASIKTHIQTQYDSGNLAFVLLVGDAAQVAPPEASGGASDPTYSKLAGGDDYPDIMVGRFSAETAAQVDTQVLRTIEYETMPATNQDWFWKGMGVASTGGPGDDGELDYEHLDNIRDDLLPYGYTTVDQIYDPTATAAQVTTGLNAGRGIVNYTGHGGPTSWSTTGFDNGDVNALTNDNMLPFICSVACNNGEFDSYTCFAEAWLRATHGSEPTGAIGVYASSIGQSWDPPMDAQDEFVDMFVSETYSALGTLLYAGSCHMMDEYPPGHPEGSGVSMFDTWHLFGDPSLRVVVSCTDAGTIALDREKYACEGTVVITLIDCGLNLDDAIYDTFMITVVSDSEPAGEAVQLTEIDPASGQFNGSIVISGTDAAGVLLVGEGNTITVTYEDADDGTGNPATVVDTAMVDCTPPIISNVQTPVVEPRNATVTFDANELAHGIVHFGLFCDALTSTAEGAGFAMSPTVGITGLDDDTTYFYAVEAEDEAGNSAGDDNYGSCYTFTTPEVPDFFTEQFDGAGDAFDLANFSVIFTPNYSADFYEGCVQQITSLPTDPAGGTDLNLSDDDYATITLSGEATVSIYGTSYNMFYPGSNGYITFVHGETGYNESLEVHFGGIPRISALFDDLNPNNGGSVSWKQLDDRAVVTWENVPEYSATGSNTFQIEMFFNGNIVMSYLSVSAQDGIVGLSDGGGLDPDYYATDLSMMGPCGPKPPTALGGIAETTVYTPVTITLQATDDGLPDPPAALTYIITELPDDGMLVDLADSETIGYAPYTLADGGNMVEYTPYPCYNGPDALKFKANDGGNSPDGGDSNEATVTISVTTATGSASLIYEFPMDVDPGWSTEGLWGFGVPAGEGSHNGDPTSGYTGLNVYGYNLDGDYDHDMTEPAYLTTTALDCSNLFGTELQFQRWLAVEAGMFDQATVEVSNDGTVWTRLWENPDQSLSESEWSQQSYDISAVADGYDTVYVRWGMGPTDGSIRYPGWNVDDVEIRAVPTSSCDFDGDNQVDLFDFTIFTACFTGPGGALPKGCNCADVDGDNDVDLLDFAIFQEERSGS